MLPIGCARVARTIARSASVIALKPQIKTIHPTAGDCKPCGNSLQIARPESAAPAVAFNSSRSSASKPFRASTQFFPPQRGRASCTHLGAWKPPTNRRGNRLPKEMLTTMNVAGPRAGAYGCPIRSWHIVLYDRYFCQIRNDGGLGYWRTIETGSKRSTASNQRGHGL